MPKMNPEVVDEVLGRVYRAGGDSADPIALRQHIDSLAKEVAEARAATLDEVLQTLRTYAASQKGRPSLAPGLEEAQKLVSMMGTCAQVSSLPRPVEVLDHAFTRVGGYCLNCDEQWGTTRVACTPDPKDPRNRA